MREDERFIELWNDYLEGELDESGIAELQALVAGDDRLLRLAADSYQMNRMLGLSGSLQWTGDGGRVFHDLSVGTELPGGTVEGMTPSS